MKKRNLLLPLVIVASSLTACQSSNHQLTPMTFDDELQLLSKHNSPIVLGSGNSKILILPEMQGRVMSATAMGDTGPTYGWFNYSEFNKQDYAIKGALGGGGRLWFGPDASEFSLFFKPNVATKPENITVPDAVSNERFTILKHDTDQVTVAKQVQFQNRKGFSFNADVRRTITQLDAHKIEHNLSISLPDGVLFVAYDATTSVTNVGSKSWKKATGLFSIWELGAFKPSASTTVVVPTSQPVRQGTFYFSNIKASHTRTTDTHLFYKADAEYMNKTGIPVSHSLPIFGSYDATRQLLTIIKYSLNKEAGDDYVNGVWKFEGEAYKGEAINIFNDGPDDFGNYFGPFYELETSSPGLTLKPQQSHEHNHQTYHFVGSEDDLSKISLSLLGLPISEINNVFNK